MKVTDLKIKNLVAYENEVFQISEIFQTEGEYFVKLENENHHLSLPAKDIQPIKITEDWLEKMGFMKTYSSLQQIRYENPENNIKYDFDLCSKKMVEGLKIYGNHIKCKYIHEFQNIFYSLFGKETLKRGISQYTNAVH